MKERIKGGGGEEGEREGGRQKEKEREAGYFYTLSLMYQ